MEPTQKRRLLGRYAILPRHYFQQLRGRTTQTKPKVKLSESQKQVKEMASVANNSQEVLLEVESVFPFTLFPNTLKVDRQKVIFIERSFFRVAAITNIQINDIQAIEADVGPFFGTLTITTEKLSQTVSNTMRYLTRKDAMAAQKLLQGFVVANRQNLEYSKIPTPKLLELIKSLGEGEGS